jgi:pimeloyl-ACP methyl ester carboxylesterase
MELNFKEFGEGQPVIILHGFLGSLDNWQIIAKDLSADFKVYLVDLRNHGKSEHTPKHSYALMSEDLKEFFAQQNIKNAYVVGHSMGGKAAMFFAAENPQLVDKLVVIDIGVKYYPPHHQDVLGALNSIDLLGVSSRAEVENHLMQHLKDNGVVQWLMKNLKREGNTFEWKFNLKDLTTEIENIGEALSDDAEYSNPTLFIRGGNSRYVLDEDIEGIMQHFPLVKMETIANAAHWVHAERPQEFGEVLQKFLKNH